MVEGRVGVEQGELQPGAVVEDGPGDHDVATVEEGVPDAGVERVRLCRTDTRRAVAHEDRAQRRLGRDLEALVLDEHLPDLVRPVDDLVEHLPDGVGAGDAERHPQLERVEAARRLEGLVDLVGGHRGPRVEVVRVVGDVAERRRVADDEGARAHWLEEGLVEVDGDRVGPLDPREQVPATKGGEQTSAVGGVDVQPCPVREGEVGDRLDRVDDAEVRRSRGGDDRHGEVAPFAHLVEGEGQSIRRHPPGGVRRDGDDRVGGEPHDAGRLDDAEVALVGREHAQAVLGILPVPPQRLSPGEDQALEVGLGAAAGEDTVRVRAEADPVGGPADEPLLDEGAAGALVPRVHGGVHRGEEALGEDRGQGDGAVEVGDVRRVVEPDRVAQVEVGDLTEGDIEAGGRVVEVDGVHGGGQVGDRGPGRGGVRGQVLGHEIGHQGHAGAVLRGGVLGQEVLVQRGAP